jgi:hypothetical protein
VRRVLWRLDRNPVRQSDVTNFPNRYHAAAFLAVIGLVLPTPPAARFGGGGKPELSAVRSAIIARSDKSQLNNVRPAASRVQAHKCPIVSPNVTRHLKRSAMDTLSGLITDNEPEWPARNSRIRGFGDRFRCCIIGQQVPMLNGPTTVEVSV